jgi:hypothetical protein
VWGRPAYGDRPQPPRDDQAIAVDWQGLGEIGEAASSVVEEQDLALSEGPRCLHVPDGEAGGPADHEVEVRSAVFDRIALDDGAPVECPLSPSGQHSGVLVKESSLECSLAQLDPIRRQRTNVVPLVSL